MDFEKEIFKRTKANFKALMSYGFKKNKDVYEYSKKFMNNFRADIRVDEKGLVTGKIYDLDVQDEYINYRIKKQTGEFVGRVREEYINILEDIKKYCFENLYYITDQANRITKKIMEFYQDEPKFLWEKFPGYGVYRNPNNEKWYAIILNIDKSKIDKKSKGEVEILNVKLDEDKIPSLLKKKGFYPSYHMSKKSWVTIVLDDTIPDEELMEYIVISHKYTESANEWIIPSNPKYFDVISYFDNNDALEWKQSSNIKVGDKVYIYVGSPYSAILYKCEAIEVNIPYEYKDKNLIMNRVMKIRLLEKYDQNKYSFAVLKKYGVNAIRGPRSIPEKISKMLNS